MPKNRGNTTLKSRRRTGDSMRDYDALPPELRAWLASAVLPWRPGSARRAYEKALQRVGSRQNALTELDRIQAKMIAKDGRKVWGDRHPASQA